MLRSLQIRNIAVIRSADIEFGGSFTALTGETGAGKSIIIDSISLLLGSRAPRELIRTGEERASVTALFDEPEGAARELLDSYGIPCEDGALLLTRSVSADGRTSARVNGQAVTQTMLREIGKALISIHGQHDNQRLMQKSSHIRLLDAYAGIAGSGLAEYGAVYGELKSARRELEALRGDQAEKNRLRDMLVYQINEIDTVKLKAGEEEELTAERLKLQSAEKIMKQTDFAYRALYGSEKSAVTLLLGRAEAALGQISDVIPQASELAARLESCRYEVEDIAQTLRAFSDFDGDPSARLDKIEGRLDTITRLERKYGSDIGQIKAFREAAAARLESLDNADERMDELTGKCKALEAKARELASALSERRHICALEAAEKVRQTLGYLDMPGVKFEIEIKPAGQLTPDGTDEVELMIATNPGEKPAPLTKIASGGELSRIMLALKCVLSENDGIGTMIFDEVDAGISGRTSRKVGIKLREISDGAQVLCVTHSAQIASLAGEHLLISKQEQDGRAQTEVRKIDGEERVNEIARILGGINITDKQRDAAREMITGHE